MGVVGLIEDREWEKGDVSRWEIDVKVKRSKGIIKEILDCDWIIKRKSEKKEEAWNKRYI